MEDPNTTDSTAHTAEGTVASDAANDAANVPAELAAAKRAARERARSARKALTADQRSAASLHIAEAVLGLPELVTARLVLAYGANAEEVDVAPLVAALRARGMLVGFPRVEAPGVLGLHLVTDDEELVRGSFDILEPTVESPRIASESLDAVIVPGVAFGPGGTRLGYGGGFYDRLLPSLRPDCARIGVCFDEQLLEDLPSEPHDATVDIVVTPTAQFRAPKRPAS